MASGWALTLKNLFLPQFCRLCRARLLTEENDFFCPQCWELSPRIKRPYCSICGRPHPHGVGLMTNSLFPCGPCAAHRASRPFRRVVGAALYTSAVEEAIKLLKFHGKRRAAKPLAELMADTAASELDPAEYAALVPVPLHRVRERERGFNQSLLLAQALSPVFPRAHIDTSLRRIRPTRTQSLLRDPEERRRNVRGAFAVVGADVAFKGTSVLLIDDVVTSHGTVAECAAALRRAGAEHVDVLTAALAAPVTGTTL